MDSRSDTPSELGRKRLDAHGERGHGEEEGGDLHAEWRGERRRRGGRIKTAEEEE